MARQPVYAQNSRGPSFYLANRRARRAAARIILAGIVACGWSLSTSLAHSAGAPRRPAAHAASTERGHPASHAPVLVLIPPYAVYAASRPGSHVPASTRGPRHDELGLVTGAPAPACPATAARRVVGTRKPAAVPAAVDLSRDDPPVADEGAIHAGAAWATGYTLLGWWAHKEGLASAPFAPMSLYAPLTGGKNRPVTLAATLALLAHQGIDTQATYRHAQTDYRHRPTAAERANARPYRIAGFSCVYAQHHSPASAETAIKAVLATGQPLVLAIAVYDNVLAASPTAPFVDLPARGAAGRGTEAVVAVAYDRNGLWVQNEWGARWGLSGYAELSWRFVNSAARQAWVIAVNHRPARSTTLRTIVATPTPTVAVSTTVPSTLTTPLTTTTESNGSCLPDILTTSLTSTAPLTNATPATTDTAGYPTATATPLGGDAFDGSAPCTSDANALPVYGTPYPSGDSSSYPTDNGAYATSVPSPAYPSYPSYPTDNFTYPTDVTPYLTVTSTPAVTATPQVADVPASGPPGSIVTVSGSGFTPGSLAVQFGSVSMGSFIVGDGAFSFPLTVPDGMAAGATTITCADSDTG